MKQCSIKIQCTAERDYIFPKIKSNEKRKKKITSCFPRDKRHANFVTLGHLKGFSWGSCCSFGAWETGHIHTGRNEAFSALTHLPTLEFAPQREEYRWQGGGTFFSLAPFLFHLKYFCFLPSSYKSAKEKNQGSKAKKSTRNQIAYASCLEKRLMPTFL